MGNLQGHCSINKILTVNPYTGMAPAFFSKHFTSCSTVTVSFKYLKAQNFKSLCFPIVLSEYTA